MLRCRGGPDTPPPEEPVFASIDGTFRDPRNMSRMLVAARERLGFGWVTSHSWRKTTATVLDGGATARMIADQLGHSKVSMRQDCLPGAAYRRRARPPRAGGGRPDEAGAK
jgi:integrase